MPNPPTPRRRASSSAGRTGFILRELEDGTTSLEDALARYERGVALLRRATASFATPNSR